MLTAGDCADAVLPARSTTWTWVDCAAPAWLKTSGLAGVALAIPDIESVALYGTFTTELFQPSAFGSGESAPNASSGGVASRLTVTDFVAVPPGVVTVQVNVVPAVSLLTTLEPQP